MSSLADTGLREAAASTWSARNQRWLSERLAGWRAHIESRAGGVAAGQAPIFADHARDFEPAALRLRALFGLSPFETELVILAAGVEIDSGLREAVARAQGMAPGQAVRLSFSLALATLPESHWDAVSPVGPLRHWSILEFDTSAGFSEGSVRIDERVLHYLTGVAAFDERLVGLAHFEDGAADHEWGDEVVARVAQAVAGSSRPLLMLADAGHDAARRRAGRSLAQAVFEQTGLRALWVDASAVPGDARDVAETARRIDREAALASAGIVVAADSNDAAPGASTMRLLAGLHSPVIVLGVVPPLQLADLPGRQVWRFAVPPPPASPQAPLPAALQRAADQALQQFRVEPELLEQALASAAGLDGEAAVEAAVWQTLRESARGGLDALAQRIDSRVTFADLVLPAPVSAQLRDIAGQLRHRHTVHDQWGFGERHVRGLGVAALFTGESGTGKTLAAEAIANEVRLDLYRIDLSSVVSKYIGETEKNLARVFDAAERSGAVLLFDEADALFGKRSEVKDSHDRYANIEIAYLLQRIEYYRGLAILTTNMKSALDRAFLRRIRFVVQFPFPDEAAREQIWRRQFPDRVPLGAIDYPALARLRLAGGHIRSIAIAAAFRAADRGGPLEHDLVVDAARAELIKLERPMTGGA
jgi:ATPase family associated with various cellular activities (AAA)/Winged helix domain, variant